MSGWCLVRDDELQSDPALRALVDEIDRERPPIGYERLLYRHLLILPGLRQYVRLILDEPGGLVVPLYLEQPAVHRELTRFCEAAGHRLLVLDGYREWLDTGGVRLVPLGVWQSIPLEGFGLQGSRMRKLRERVRRFERSGQGRVEEYDAPSPATLRRMRELICGWVAAKHNVIEHSAVCMEHLLSGKLPPAHRGFLTFHDDRLCSVIVVERSADGAWIMDQEFYDPASAPPGHMDYAVVQILERLRGEGASSLSLGLTWHPFPAAAHPRTDPQARDWLEQQVRKRTLLCKVFEQGLANYQFKKKFAPQEEPFFAYLEREAPLSTVLQFWPVFMTHSLSADRLIERLARIPLDLQSDTWHGRESAPVRERTAALRRGPAADPEQALREIFPFEQILLAPRGRDAEALFYRALGPGRILSTISWTTTLAHQLGNGFEVEELPHPSVLEPSSDHLFKGEFDLAGLAERLARGDSQIAMLGLELLSNASGGHPVRLSHLQQVRALAQEHGVPLVLDASRVVRNACLLREHEAGCTELDVWELVRRTLSQADHVVASLTKDFAVPYGGLLATNDGRLAAAIRQARPEPEFEGLDPDWRRLTLPDRERVLELVARQLSIARQLGALLRGLDVLLLEPVVGHALMIDVGRPQSGETLAQIKQRFLEELFVETGIRGGVHQAGKQKNTVLDRCIRLALPLGLTEAEGARIGEALAGFFGRRQTRRPAADAASLVAACTPEQRRRLESLRDDRPALEIAVVGLGGRFPGAADVHGFWRKLQQGERFIEEVPAERWDHRELLRSGATRCRFGAFLERADTFDAPFFGLQPEEVRGMDPQERLALEAVWSCIEDAGYRPEQLGPEVGVFAGVTYNEFQKLLPTTSHSCFVSSRIAFQFDFQGPSISVDTGCCSSLSAIELACQSLARGECAAALVVGANLLLHPHHYVGLSAQLKSGGEPECAPFGTGDGWIPAEGVVAILLKPLPRAVAERDHPYAVIRACRSRQEGRTAWFTAPNPRRQAELIQGTFEAAGIDPRTISYVEAAANGSALGDAVEFEGLTTAFRRFTAARGFCPIGSVKARVGHGEAVAPLLQLAQVILQLRTRTILPLPEGTPSNPKIQLEQSPFCFPRSTRAWEPPAVTLDGRRFRLPRRATISAFGGGGNMAHLILEEAPAAPRVEGAPPEACCIPLSAPSPAGLRRTAARYLEFLETLPTLDADWALRYSLANVGFTLCLGRVAFAERLVLLPTELAELPALLSRYLAGEQDARIVTRGGAAGCPEPARAWAGGAEVDWAPLFAGRAVERVSLPTHCFEPIPFPLPAAPQAPAATAPTPPAPRVAGGAATCREILAELLGQPAEALDVTLPLDRLGFDSMLVAAAAAALEQRFGPVPETLFFECRTLQELIDAVTRGRPELAPATSKPADEPIAVVGLAGRYPMAHDVGELWQRLVEGADCVTEVPADRWDWRRHHEADRRAAAATGRTYCRWGGFIDGHDRFDCLFFHISPREALAMDPQERLFLEIAWATLEDAGYTRAALAGERVGVFVGSSWQEYPLHAAGQDGPAIATNACNIANRVSYLLDLEGPSLALDTACSSSLTAVHLACASIRSGESDLALAGGVNLSIHPNKYLALTRGQFFSSRGRCESFGEGGDGYVPGEGVGAILLKPLSRAVADRDRIHGVIRGSAINHGGRTNGYSVPDPAAQAAVVALAWRRAGVDAREVGCIEAHGTGTALGDPIEIEGLNQAFRRHTADRGFCSLGSLKSNIGHCEAAAGIAGVTKVLLQLVHRQLAPSLHAEAINPRIDLAQGPFVLQRELAPWPRPAGGRRLAGVSSFGAGGANAHLVIEEAPELPAGRPADRPCAVLLSARTEDRLSALAARLDARLAADPSLDLDRLAYTLQVGREAMELRLALLASSVEELRAQLGAVLAGRDVPGLFFRGRADDGATAAGEELDAWIERRRYDRLLPLWVSGGTVDWARLWPEPRPQRIGLPTYPFAGDRHWIGPERAADLHCFEEVWQPEPLPAAPAAAPGALLVLGGVPAQQDALRRAVEAQVRFCVAEDLVRSEAVVCLGSGEPAEFVPWLQALHAAGPPERLLLAGEFHDGLSRCRLESWIGFERSLRLAWPRTAVTTLMQPAGEARMERVWQELCLPQAGNVLYQGGVRHTLRVRPVELPAAGRTVRGTILITGGCGGLGLLFAEHLARRGPVKLILCGRTAPDRARRARIAALERGGCEVFLLQADVCDATRMRAGLAAARERLGPVEGLIHAAGLPAGAALFDKPPRSFQEVLAPKVQGTLVLDLLLAEDPLQFACYFSSSAAVLGDFGACDYAVANRFLTAYAAQRSSHRGRTIAINWPLWRDGGMGAGESDAAAFYLETSGQRALLAEEGLALFDRILAGERAQCLVLAGRQERIERFLAPEPVAAPRATNDRGLERRVAAALRDAVVELLDLPREELAGSRNLADYGFDSISLAELAGALSQRFELELTPDLFFGHATLDRLTAYFVEHQAEAMQRLFGMQRAPAAAPSVPGKRPVPPSAEEPIAVIGISGRFPGARDAGALWEVLAGGIDAVGEIPVERFDWRASPELAACRWCGTVPGVAEFDPLFFEISPREAAGIDPRQRLLLQESWNALEDAGYGPRQLAGGRTGMFVGVEEGDYPQIATEGPITGNHGGVLAARLAYFLDLQGPVMALNTACSSSLVAAHQACQSLRSGECDTALAAGVSLLLTPGPLLAMSRAGLLSPDGRCRAFDRAASGLVPGEAVAVVVLKRLSRAVADGDPIHATILASGINYDGKTTGITAPSRAAQAALIREVHQRHGIDPERIEYIVTHGTGTPLGDPVEINALADAFAPVTSRRGFCALTSTKSNLGHSFAASGLVSLIGLVQALRHATIPPSLHCEAESDYIRWEASPFYVNRTARPWPAAEGAERIGAVSAFGMSGTNAHLVLQGHTTARTGPAADRPHHLLALSAKTEPALRERARVLGVLLGGERAPELADVAGTLLDGRHHFRRRCALVVADVGEAVERLARLAAGDGAGPFHSEVPLAFEPQPALDRAVEQLQARGRTVAENDPEAYRELLCGLAALYCQGYPLSGGALHGEQARRIHLPGYPFARERYWPGETPAPAADEPAQTLLLRPVWVEAPAPLAAPQPARWIVASCGTGDVGDGPFERHTLCPDEFTAAAAELLRLLQALLERRPAERCLVQLLVPESGEGRLLAGLAGMLKTAQLEHPARLVGQTIELDPALSGDRLRALLEESARLVGQTHLRFSPEARVPGWEEVPPGPAAELPWRPDGVYLITGGAGGLGRLLAREITSRVPGARLILCGRSALGPGDSYQQADVSRLEEVERLVRSIVARHGALHGVLHAAGALRDGPLVDKREEALREVLAAKVAGTLHLERATRNLALDHLVLFSSCSGVEGNPGQADYAAANAFMDAFAEQRGAPVLSIAWPLWREGGMGIDPRRQARLREQTGLVPLESAQGFAALCRAMALGQPRTMVLCGERSRIEPAPRESLDAATRRRLGRFVAAELRLPPGRLDPREPFEAYGVDSIVAAQLNAQLEAVFPEISRTVFYEHPTLESLAGHLAAAYPAACRRWSGAADAPAPRPAAAAVPAVVSRAEPAEEDPVAIVGISGRYAGAADLRELWQRLIGGESCIGEVPAERWDWRAHPQIPGRWGGFLEHVTRCDPLFFQLAPRDAARLDPQELLLLELAWQALEDAGSAPCSLPERAKRRGGVFVGATQHGLDATSFSSIANRISHALDLRGPSVAIDAMCASAHLALHQACEYLRRGGGELALAGAVNLYLHPAAYTGLAAGGSLAAGPDCAAFGEGGAGFVPGEGGGVVLLKPYRLALRDGDPVHALILGTACSHAGAAAGGYGAPSPAAQVAAIEQALAEARVDRRSIGYVESAATGQQTADAVEATALTRVFSDRAGADGEFGIGSLKPNIGHCQAAAGMSQLAKVVLSLQRQTLAPTRLSGPLNPAIRFDRLPFRLQREAAPWRPVTVDGAPAPRRAGITGVGAGGVAAHLILEQAPPAGEPVEPGAGPWLFVLSAKSRERLEAYADRWLERLADEPRLDPARAACTLQLGREPLRWRLAVVFDGPDELARRLRNWRGDPRAGGCHVGEAEQAAERTEAVERAEQTADLDRLARLWVAGHPVRWAALYGGQPPRRLAGLPGYPFERRECGTEQAPNKAAEFYGLAATAAETAFSEEYLTFAPFAERVPGFSVTRVCLDPGRHPEELALVRERQLELRRVLFAGVDLDRIETLLDIGCGHGTDLIRLAEEHPRLVAHGFTITGAQAELGQRRVRERGLDGRVEIFHADSAADPFPGRYELILGIEVTFHIRDKQALFGKIAGALEQGGTVLLADYVAHTRGAIADPRVEVTVSTREQWTDLLSSNGLVIERAVDVSDRIANFLHDPELEQNIAGLPAVVRDTWRNYVHQSAALERGWISYVLLRLRRENPGPDRAERERTNAAMLSRMTPYAEALAAESAPAADPGPRLAEIFVQVLGLAPGDLDRSTRLRDLGVGSVNAVRLLEAINQAFELRLPSSVLFEHDTLGALAAQVARGLAADRSRPLPAVATRPARGGIAIVGLACRCAGADDPEALWELVRRGEEQIREMPREWIEFLAGRSSKPAPSRYGAMSGADCFDSLFFRISPTEASHMDPGQRLLLEEGYRALEDAGYAPRSLAQQRVGTYIGLAGGSLGPASKPHLAMLGSDTSIAASRLAHFLDLKGPVLAINTACSSSLVAVEVACRALDDGSIDLALAGGVTVWTDPAAFLAMNDAGMLSPGGTCRPFDDCADGTVVGDGVGLVVLKRLADAKRDGDRIHGVIRGIGTNQDGRTSGITVPSYLAQSELQAAVYQRAAIAVDQLQYLETHGTATRLGDPVEIHALCESFRRFTPRRQFCAIGSLKANIGHTAAAAGVLGLIKVLLCLRERRIPPAVNFARPNAQIDFAGSPVFVNTELRDWPANEQGSRLAAVSSFGYSGTNAHLVLEQHEAAPEPAIDVPAGPQLVVLSAEDAPRLREVARNLRAFLERRPVELVSLAHTLQVGRDAMAERIAWVVGSTAELAQELDRFLAGDTAASRAPAGESALARLARRWLDGEQIAWDRPHGARRISLPTYPFARQSAAAETPSPALEPTGLFLFEEVWEPAALDGSQGDADEPRSLLVFLSDPGWRSIVRQRIAARNPACEVRFVAIEEGLNQTGEVDGVLYLWPLEAAEKIEDAAGIAVLLRALRDAGLRPRRVLLAGEYADGLQRAHLESWIGFERSAGRAWPGAAIAAILREANGAEGRIEEWVDRLWDELTAGPGRSALYRQGSRLELGLRKVESG